jgi:hypothetical protein
MTPRSSLYPRVSWLIFFLRKRLVRLLAVTDDGVVDLYVKQAHPVGIQKRAVVRRLLSS